MPTEPTPLAFPPHVALHWARRRDWRGGWWDAYLCDPIAFPGQLGVDAFGYTWFLHRVIFVSAAQSRAQQAVTYFHELFHVAFEGAGGLGADDEEGAIDGTDERLVALIEQDGWRAPPLPAGAEALEREAFARFEAARLEEAHRACPAAAPPPPPPKPPRRGNRPAPAPRRRRGGGG